MCIEDFWGHPEPAEGCQKNLATNYSNLVARIGFLLIPFYLRTSKKEAAKREGTAEEGGNPKTDGTKDFSN